MYKKYKIFVLSLASMLFFTSCQDVIDVDLNSGQSQLSVDAWVNNLSEAQTIRLTQTQSYFDNNPAPGATGATVSIQDANGKTYAFKDSNNDGNYVWTPATPGESLGDIGSNFLLTVNYQGETYNAVSEMKRVPKIDSIIYEFREGTTFDPEGYYVTFYARDLEGEGDIYWIKSFKNGVLLDDIDDLNLAYDAAYSPGNSVDGKLFILPIRELNNPSSDDGRIISTLQIGDEIRVEIHSISPEAFFFFQEVEQQLNNSGLFATPSANVSTNIINKNPNGKKAVGFFNTAVISKSSVTLEK